MAMTTAAKSATTAMNLPVAHVAPGQSLAEAFVKLDGWQELQNLIQALAADEVQARLAYAYQLPDSNQLLVKLVLDVTATGADEPALTRLLGSERGVEVVSVQAPAENERGLVMSERQRPELVGTPAAIFGRPLIGSLTHRILEAQGEAGKRLLSQLGHDAGHLAASGLPPLLEQLGMTISDDLLTRRMRDLQVMGWATFERASIENGSQGEVTLVDTFEAVAWNGEASSATCHFLRGFIEGVFSFAWGKPVTCREVECQATGAAACRFTFSPS